MKKDLINLGLIFIIGFVMRFIFPFSFYAFNKDYWFLDNSFVYYIKYDSWHYARLLDNIIPKVVLYFLPYIIFFIGLVFFYYTIKNVYATFMLSIAPVIYTDSLFGFIDTPCIIFFYLCVSIYMLKKIYEGNYWLSPILILFVFTLRIFWAGSSLVLVLMLILLLFFFFSKLQKILIIILSIIAVLLMGGLLKLKSLGVSEYATNKFIIIYFLVICVIYLYYTSHTENPQINAVFFLAIPSFMIQRITFFLMPFLIILLFEYKANNYVKFFFTFFFMFNVINTAFIVYPILDRDVERELQNVTEPVYDEWGKGHMINYFTNGKAVFYASPSIEYFEYEKSKNLNSSYIIS